MIIRWCVYPVCEETVDHVVGVLNIKDFFRFRGRTKDFIMKHAVKPAQFIPKSVKADVLFRRMKVSHNHFAAFSRASGRSARVSIVICPFSGLTLAPPLMLGISSEKVSEG